TSVAANGGVVALDSNAAHDTATVTIADDDATTVSIAATTAAAAEPSTNGQFTVSLAGGKVAGPGGITVTYTVAGSTATADSDYTALTGTVTILEGDSSAVIDVTVLDDNIVEPCASATLFRSTSVAANGGVVALDSNAA